MTQIARAMLALSLGVFLAGLVASDVVAQECSPLADCPTDLVCVQGLFGPRCVEFRCNFDSECPSSRPLCRGGACMTTTPPGGRGVSQSGPGGACGPRRFGQVIKNVGCRPGLRCTNGTCQRLQT